MPKSENPSVSRPDSGSGAAAAAVAPAGPEPESYEQAVAELERLVLAMEGGQLPLDQILRSYQRGAQLLAFCRERLQAVEQQVQVLENGQLKPWAPPREPGA